MILKVRDEQDFNISMNLNINYELEYIELTVNVWNKKAHTQQTKTFTASRFSEALAYYRQQETFLFGAGEQAGGFIQRSLPAGYPQSNAERTSFLIGRSIPWQTRMQKRIGIYWIRLTRTTRQVLWGLSLATPLRTLMRFAKLSERPVCRPGHISPAEKCWW